MYYIEYIQSKESFYLLTRWADARAGNDEGVGCLDACKWDRLDIAVVPLAVDKHTGENQLQRF